MRVSNGHTLSLSTLRQAGGEAGMMAGRDAPKSISQSVNQSINQSIPSINSIKFKIPHNQAQPHLGGH